MLRCAAEASDACRTAPAGELVSVPEALARPRARACKQVLVTHRLAPDREAAASVSLSLNSDPNAIFLQVEVLLLPSRFLLLQEGRGSVWRRGQAGLISRHARVGSWI